MINYHPEYNGETLSWECDQWLRAIFFGSLITHFSPTKGYHVINAENRIFKKNFGIYNQKENAAVDWKKTMSKLRTIPLSRTHAIVISNCHKLPSKSPHNWTLGFYHSMAELWQLPPICSWPTSISPNLPYLFTTSRLTCTKYHFHYFTKFKLHRK